MLKGRKEREEVSKEIQSWPGLLAKHELHTSTTLVLSTQVCRCAIINPVLQMKTRSPTNFPVFQPWLSYVSIVSLLILNLLSHPKQNWD